MDDAAVRAMFMDKDGKMRWLDYIDYLTFGKTFESVKYEKEVNDDEATEDDTVDKAAMTARFEEWMKKYDKTYGSKEKKAMCYEMFKKTVKRTNRFNASKGTSFSPNGLADIIDEQYDSLYVSTPYVDHFWEEHVALLKSARVQSKEVNEDTQIIKSSSLISTLIVNRCCSFFPYSNFRTSRRASFIIYS